jgi:hypothetical protein
MGVHRIELVAHLCRVQDFFCSGFGTIWPTEILYRGAETIWYLAPDRNYANIIGEKKPNLDLAHAPNPATLTPGELKRIKQGWKCQKYGLTEHRN